MIAAALAVVPMAGAEIRNGGFEEFVDAGSETAGVPIEWPTTETWCRSDGGITPYIVSGEDAHEGDAFVVLLQWSPDSLPFFGLAHDPASEGINATGINLLPVKAGQSYTVSFWSRRWFDDEEPDSVNDALFLPPSNDAPTATLRAYAFFSASTKVGGDAKFLGDVVAPSSGTMDGDYEVTGKWAPSEMTVVAPTDGFLWLGFKIKPPTAAPGLEGYGHPAAAGVKIALDDVKIGEAIAP